MVRPALTAWIAALLASAVGCDASDGPDEDCAALRAAMASGVARGMSMQCTGVVRFDYESLAPLGYAIFCGNSATVDEAAARAAATLDLDLTSLPGGGDPGTLISDPRASVFGGDELYVFSRAPSDFGDVAVVSARNGFTLFGGSIVRMGAGGILYPHEWQPPSALGSTCSDAALGIDGVRSFDLGESGGALPDTAPVMQALKRTVLPGALLDGTYAYLKNAVILLYPRSVGEFDAATAEYVVFLNAGWE